MKAHSTYKHLRQIAVAAAIGLLALPAGSLAAKSDVIELNKKTSHELYIDSDEMAGRGIQLFLGASTVLDGKGVRKVFVSNPDVVKVHVVTIKGRNYMVLTAKKEGYCDLVRIGEDGPLPKIAVTVSQAGSNTTLLQSEIDRLLPRSTVEVRKGKEGFAVTGRVDTKQEMDLLLQLLSRYTVNIDNQVTIGQAKQIKLEAKIIEMSRTKLKEAGINLLGIGSSATAGIFTAGSLTSFSAGRGSFSDLTTVSPFTEAFQLLLGIGDISSVLSILENKGITKTLSNPSITTEDNKPAKLFVGGSIPVPVPQTGTNVVTIQWKDYGIKLDFVPHVTKKGTIALKVQAEAGDLSPNKGVTIGGTTVPAIDTRRVDSEVTLAEGEDLVIAGLLFSKDQNTIDSVPVLGDIPVIGAFFKKAYDSREELELVVILKPYFVTPNQETAAYEEELKPLEPMRWSDYLMGTVDDRIK